MSEAYHFAHSIWIEKLIGASVSRKSVLRAALLAVLPWLIGLLICLPGGYWATYLSTPAFYVGSFGIFLATIGLAYGAAAQYGIYDRLLTCFELTAEQRRGHIIAALERHSGIWRQVRAGVSIFAIGAILSTSGLIYWPVVRPISSKLGTYLPRFRVLVDHGWYNVAISHYTILLLMVYLLIVSLVLGTAVSIILRMPIFLWNISSETTRLPPGLIKYHFKPAATLYSVTSILWLGGVGTLSYFLGLNRDWLSFLIVGAAFLCGILNLAIPQIAYLRVISRAEDDIFGYVSARFESPDLNLSLKINPDNKTIADGTESISIGDTLSLLKYEDWVFPIHQSYFVFLTYLLSVIGSLVGWKRIASVLFPIG